MNKRRNSIDNKKYVEIIRLCNADKLDELQKLIEEKLQ